MSEAATWAVELDDFAKSYRRSWTGQRACAVQAVSLRLAPGQVLGLLGPNGSGKSTLLKALAGLIRPTAGRCLVGGHPAGSDAARALTGYLSESPRLATHQTGREFLAYCAGLSAMKPGLIVRRLGEVLEWSELGAAADRPLDTYSKGMLQRIGLAQAVLHDPAVVLLDEPASGLDPQGRLALAGLVRGLAGRGKAVVFSSHLLGQAEGLCDRLALLGQGRILAEGPTRELIGTGPSMAHAPSRLEQLYLEKLRP